MKYIILLTILLGVNSAFSAELYCNNKFNDMEYDLLINKQITCWVDAIYGSDSVCFRGDASEIVTVIESGYFNDLSKGLKMEDPFVNEEGNLQFVGVDAQSFWQQDSVIEACAK